MNINLEIAITHVLAKKRQTLVVALGITIGIGIFIFMNSLVIGVNRYSDRQVFKTVPHIRVYKEDELSKTLVKAKGDKDLSVIINPKISNNTKNIINPIKLVSDLKKQPDVVAAAPLVSVNLFYNNGKSQVDGIASGMNILEANTMFDVQSTMVEGDLRNLLTTSNGILIGVGVADKLSLKVNDNLSVTSALGIIKVMKIVGIFKTGVSATDKSKSYINISAAQELLHQGPSYVTDIYVNVKNPDKAPLYSNEFSAITGYKAEDWQSANATLVSAKSVRAIMFGAIGMAILLVAAFGIYNVLNMTILQKMNEIAILKATGFQGADVVKIFISEALIIGIVGIITGLFFGLGLVYLLKQIYIGGDIGYFPVSFDPIIFTVAGVFGFIITFLAGYIPAKKAAKVDPISIFRNL